MGSPIKHPSRGASNSVAAWLASSIKPPSLTVRIAAGLVSTSMRVRSCASWLKRWLRSTSEVNNPQPQRARASNPSRIFASAGSRLLKRSLSNAHESPNKTMAQRGRNPAASMNRRTVESLKAQQEQARFALAATNITLSSNVAAAAIQEASLRAQIDATDELIKINTNMLEILRSQYAKGYASELDVAAQESQLAQMAATLPPLLKQLAQQRDLLTVLAGGFPDKDMAEKFELSSLQLPHELPLSLPSKLVEQRPDVRQAEENLHSASALIGVARANRLPSFNLTGDIGSMALAFGNIFSAGNGFRAIGASVTQPIFDGGTLMHRERAARAAYVQADEQYRSTVLTAFQNVADTLNALQQDAEGLKAAAGAKDAAAVTLDLAKKQFQAGYVNYLGLLSTEQAYQQAVITLAQAQGNRYADTAALFQALGGGWWNRPDVPQN